jgi:hypothetical protein
MTANLIVTHSTNLDTLCFFDVLTGDEFYTSRHEDAYALWRLRLPDAQGQVARAAEAFGSTMLGPHLTLVISAMPDFDELPLSRLLDDTDELEEWYRASSYYDVAVWPSTVALCNALLPVVGALEEAGFRRYWSEERLPLVEESARRLHEIDREVDLNGLIASMLGIAEVDEELIRLYLCSFAAPHGIRISGRAYISDVRFSPETTLRIAIHEMFHPPFRRDKTAFRPIPSSCRPSPAPIRNTGTPHPRVFSKRTSSRPWSLR